MTPCIIKKKREGEKKKKTKRRVTLYVNFQKKIKLKMVSYLGKKEKPAGDPLFTNLLFRKYKGNNVTHKTISLPGSESFLLLSDLQGIKTLGNQKREK